MFDVIIDLWCSPPLQSMQLTADIVMGIGDGAGLLNALTLVCESCKSDVHGIYPQEPQRYKAHPLQALHE